MLNALKIGVVGACGTGKSELVSRLNDHGYQAHHIAQEHSYTPDMWQIFINPDILIYLQVSYPVTLERKRFYWTEEEYNNQLVRLQHARTHADLKINTDNQTPSQVFDAVLTYLLSNAEKPSSNKDAETGD